MKRDLMTSEVYLRELRMAVPEEFPKGTRILIAGASGLIGSFLVDALLLTNKERGLGLTVCAMSRNMERLQMRFSQHVQDESLQLLAQDVTEPLPEGSSFDMIVHAGSPAHPKAFATDPVGTMKANLLGTMNLLEHIRRQGHGRILYISSGEIYGENIDGIDFAEDSLGYIDCANPRSCYPESKRAAETLCVSYAKQYAVDALIARPCHVYGPTITDENSRADAQFLRNALDGQNIVMKSAGSQVRSYLYVSDAAAAMLHLLVHGESAAAYNLANPDSVMSIREYAQLLADCAGVELRTELPSDVELAGFSKVTRATFDVKKLMNTGFVPQYAPELGVRQMIEILRNVTPVK